ncbi:MAG: UDP-N-acetylglucosamine 2-epimerase (non-hydrolyzing) [bacterium]|nr:UDP-N-acetylglucosamine 2-epimerase (non-hydrolyzing) [bacterium]
MASQGQHGETGKPSPIKILTLIGTRPEVIKLAPVIRALESTPGVVAVNTASGQHTDLFEPLAQTFDLQIHQRFRLERRDPGLASLTRELLEHLDELFEREQPDMILVQGDTTTAMIGALGGFYRRIPVGHVEARLRSGNPDNPFPEEINRRLIGQLATVHYAPTPRSARTLIDEGIADSRVEMVGNPVVDSLPWALSMTDVPERAGELIDWVGEQRLILLTTHRRESFGRTMAKRLHALRAFVCSRDDLALVFPVHPNPAVREAATRELGECDRIKLIAPLDYLDFIHLARAAWLLVSDSGGVQEEAPTLGTPLLVIRDNTERPEAVEAGVARLAGGPASELSRLLEQTYDDSAWHQTVWETENPFGDGASGQRIARSALRYVLEAREAKR